MGWEQQGVDQWLYGTLAAATAVAALVGGTAAPRIYDTQAPQNASYPRLRFQPLSAIAYDTLPLHRNHVVGVYLVAASGTTSYGAVQAIMAAADTALHGQHVLHTTSEPDLLITCEQEEQIKFAPEALEGGREVREVGARYRIWAQPQ